MIWMDGWEARIPLGAERQRGFLWVRLGQDRTEQNGRGGQNGGMKTDGIEALGD